MKHESGMVLQGSQVFPVAGKEIVPAYHKKVFQIHKSMMKLSRRWKSG